MSPWATFYAGREGASYRDYVRGRYAPFIDAIADRLGNNSLVLELGAGTGAITSILADYYSGDNNRFAASDIEPEMVEMCKGRMAAMDLDVSCFQMDAVNSVSPPRADVVHSHGMLEHFDDATIRTIIRRFEWARVQVHYVPGLYPSPTFGDERLMSVDAWWKICKPSQIITFNDGLDYALVFEQ